MRAPPARGRTRAPCRLVAQRGVGVDARGDDTAPGRKPVSTVDSASRLRTSRPAAITSTTASAIWAMVNERAETFGDRRASPRPPDSITRARPVRRRGCTGAKPNRQPVKTARRHRTRVPASSAARRAVAACPRQNDLQPLGALGRERDAEQAAEARQEHALGEELPGDSPRPGAERSANRDLPIARRRACQRRDSPRWRTRSAGSPRRHRTESTAGARVGDQVPLQRYDTHVRIPAGGHLPWKQRQDTRLEQPNLDACLLHRRPGRRRPITGM